MVTTGVLGTLAVLMTRNPDMPLGAAPPQRLPVPIHFAPVTGSQPGACTTSDGMPDDTGQTCYTLAGGVSVTAVRKIETVQDSNGAYSVRIALAPAFRERINDLTQEAVKQQIAIVVGEKVVAAPRVAQVITEDSLSIAGSFTKEQADAMVARLRGTAGGATPSPSQSQPAQAPTSSAVVPSATAPTGTASNGTTSNGTTSDGTAPDGTAPTGTGPTGTGPTGTGPTGTGPTGGASGATAPATASTKASATAPAAQTANRDGLDTRYPDCKTARREGYGPYFRDSRPEEYGWYVDKNNNGIACDSGDLT
ncbi:SecDF P1 head subdomain-containing protein [Streptosporangium sp. CA-135522]|uniref:SecDF P1 head subdomain-containing protein n=1 Tax=Streptosporangium sp. CA-135522 TaxID=3240072 RepID=UPI003D8BCAA2